jgi:putative holliday junction resolvase
MTVKRMMSIDPGSKRIGIALSDTSGRFSRPFCILEHSSRKEDAFRIAEIASKNDIVKIIIGISLDENNLPTYSGRSAMRLAEEVQAISKIPIVLWDEYETTNQALELKINLGIKRKNRKGHQDDLAAAILLQSYIEHQIEQKLDQ